MTFPRHRAAISAAALSCVGRLTDRSATSHLVEATRAALQTSGLNRDDIDGLATYPGRMDLAPGMAPIGCVEARDALGLRTRWHSASAEGPAQLSPIMIAAMAVATGQARHVLCFRALTESSSQTLDRRASIATGKSDEIGGWLSWLLPTGAMSAANWAAMIAARYMHEFDLHKEDLGAQVVRQRANARYNPSAVFKAKPLTIEDYMSARMISDPLGLYDCDVPVDGACAVIVSEFEAAKELKLTPLRLEAFSSSLTGRDSWDQRSDLTTMAAHDVGRDIWTRTKLRPQDIDLAGLYDGFSIFVPLWLEALGFCPHGTAGAFMRRGETALSGSIPTNTGGGQLSAGRMHGFGHLHEACIQLWGQGGERQVRSATNAICGVGGGPLAGAMILSID